MAKMNGVVPPNARNSKSLAVQAAIVGNACRPGEGNEGNQVGCTVQKDHHSSLPVNSQMWADWK